MVHTVMLYLEDIVQACIKTVGKYTVLVIIILGKYINVVEKIKRINESCRQHSTINVNCIKLVTTECTLGIHMINFAW